MATMEIKKVNFKNALRNDLDWKPVLGFEKEYEVHWRGVVRRIETKENLRRGIGTTGYYMCSLWKNGVGHTKKIHRLVAQAYLPNPENKPEVNHKDSIRLNPHVANLEWVTKSENRIHSLRYGNGVLVNPPKEVIQYDLHGNEVARHKGTIIPGFDSWNVCGNCNGRQKTHRGFIFKWA